MSVNRNEDERLLSMKYLVKSIREGQEHGERFCFILGAGASVSSGIPTGAQLEYRWMEDMEKDPGMKEVRAAAERLKRANSLDHEFDQIAAVWEEAKREKRTTLPSEYYFDIYTLRFHPNHRNGYHYLENLMQNAKPSFGYHPLSLMLTDNKGSNLVITTNFDSLVEDSLFLYTDQKPLVINHELLAEFAGDLNIRRPVIAKLHRGLFFDPFNRAKETRKLHGRWKKVLKKVFQNYTPIVIGYGGGDSSLMGVLKEKSVTMKNGLYWCYVEKYGLPDERIQTIVKKKGGHFVPTAGFDAVMLAVGNALYQDQIEPAGTEKYLGAKIDTQIANYGEEYERLVEEETTEEGEAKSVVESEREFGEEIEELERRVSRSENEREKQEKMTVWDYVRQGNRFWRAGKYEEAIDSYTKSIGLLPTSSAFSNRGNAYFRLNQYETAILEYNKALELNPNNAVAYHGRGCAYEKLGEYEKALADCNTAINLKPDHVPAYNDRGYIYEKMGEQEKAIEDYSKAIQLNPDYSTGYNNRGYSYASMGEYEKAVLDYKKAIELKPDYANPYKHFGALLRKQGKLQKAEKYLTKAIELNPEYKEAWQERAEVYHALGEEEKAAGDEAMAAKL